MAIGFDGHSFESEIGRAFGVRVRKRALPSAPPKATSETAVLGGTKAKRTAIWGAPGQDDAAEREPEQRPDGRAEATERRGDRVWSSLPARRERFSGARNAGARRLGVPGPAPFARAAQRLERQRELRHDRSVRRVAGGCGPSPCLASNRVMAPRWVATSTQRMAPPHRLHVSRSARKTRLSSQLQRERPEWSSFVSWPTANSLRARADHLWPAQA
jgi:hypothetical protein